MLDKLNEIGAYELYFDGFQTYSIRFIDLMKSGECFMGSSLEGVIETAYRYAKNPDWLNEKIPMPSYIVRRPTKRAADVRKAGTKKVSSKSKVMVSPPAGNASRWADSPLSLTKNEE